MRRVLVVSHCKSCRWLPWPEWSSSVPGMCLPSVDQARKISFFSFFQCYFCYSFLWCKTQKQYKSACSCSYTGFHLFVLVFSCFSPVSFSFSSCHLQLIQLPLNKVVGTMKAFPSEGNPPEKDKVCHLALQNTPICADAVHAIVAVSVLDMCPLCLH